jgi:hypothetical protein
MRAVYRPVRPTCLAVELPRRECGAINVAEHQMLLGKTISPFPYTYGSYQQSQERRWLTSRGAPRSPRSPISLIRSQSSD